MAVITISRQSGSEGNEITRLLCERLGYRFFDKNLMAKLAVKMGLTQEELVDVSVDQHHARTLIERIFGNYQAPFGESTGWTPAYWTEAEEAKSVEQMRALIQAAYEQGNVIIVGRGGQAALAGRPGVLHVRVVAPLDMRIKRWQAREGLDYDAARQRVRERDAAHIDFVRRFFNADIADPALYDLVINTAQLTPATAAGLISAAVASLPLPA